MMATICSSGGWSTLPSIIIIEILSLLPLKDRLNASRVCRSWRDCLFHPSLWRRVVFRVNSCVDQNESCRFLVNNFGRFTRNVVIELNSLNPKDVRECKDILDVLTYNKNLERLSMKPNSCRLEWIEDDLGQEDNLLDMYITSLEQIICNAHRLKHMSLGCIEELLNHSDLFLTLLSQHQFKSLQSLHLASIKEDPEHYALLDLPINTFEVFGNLQYLSIDYDYVSDCLLYNLSKSRNKSLRHLNIHVHGIDTEHPGTTDNAWKQLKNLSPQLEVTMTLLHSHDPSTVLQDIFHPSMPLAHFRAFFSSGLDAELLDDVAILNCNTLKSISLVESLGEDSIPIGPFRPEAEDPLVMLAWRCQNLTHLSVVGYCICDVDLIGIARLRGPQLKELNIPACCIAVYDMENNNTEYLHNTSERVCTWLLNEMACSLGRQWTPMSAEEIPPPVANYTMDADGTYLNQLLRDQCGPDFNN
ncbi:F-box only protein 33-like [Centruroides sculpturatus]|uniref:F-box only protein 33-like n=1 Tax=Centruroides sculpturatus TaxID=218467 RepID=UPI000C6DF3EB|nr:F-box only protein 33-like [Centruroides sculpturatus]